MNVFDASEEAIRPEHWDDYVGQIELKRDLDIIIQAARRDDHRLDHILLAAQPGAGKTALAKLIADRMERDLEYIKCPMKPSHFCDLMEFAEDTIVMLDEVHNASAAFKELLLTGLEGGVLVTPDGFRIDVSTVTFIAATTTEQLEQLGRPLQDRFEIKPSWVPYTDEEMAEIILGMAGRLGFAMSPELARDLSRAAGGTPRLSKRLVKRARDLGPGATATEVLRLVGVDADGLDANHWQYLQVLDNMGGRAGIAKLKNILQMSVPMIEELERLLVLRGCIRFEPTGRKITQIGARKLTARRKEAA